MFGFIVTLAFVAATFFCSRWSDSLESSSEGFGNVNPDDVKIGSDL